MDGTRTFYRSALLMPLLFPIIFAVVTGLQRGLGSAVAVLGSALVSLGAAYLVLLVALLSWSRARSGRQLQKAARLAPVFYALILLLHQALEVLIAWPPHVTRANVADRMVGSLFIGLVYGYVCVGIAEAVYGVPGEVGLIDHSGDASGA